MNGDFDVFGILFASSNRLNWMNLTPIAGFNPYPPPKSSGLDAAVKDEYVL